MFNTTDVQEPMKRGENSAVRYENCLILIKFNLNYCLDMPDYFSSLKFCVLILETEQLNI